MSSGSLPPSANQETREEPQDFILNPGEVTRRLRRGLPQILAALLLGFSVGLLGFEILTPQRLVTTGTRAVFSFEGAEHSEYPDKSRFSPEDLRTPDIIYNSLLHLQLEKDSSLQGVIRGALNIEGIVPPSVIRERDRMRASGSTPPPYIPDEYNLTLTLPVDFPLPLSTREAIVREIVASFSAKFVRTYATLPITFGNAFASLHNADYFEYELILNSDLQAITTFLNQQLDKEEAKSFRSATTQFSFHDLVRQTQLFSQIRLNETLGLIHQNGLSHNRNVAMVKLDYYFQTLQSQEQRALEDDRLVRELLQETQNRTENYVLAVKSQAATNRSNNVVVDQGLVDSLLANDSYNLLIRRALDSGFNVKRVQSEKLQLVERRKNMESFLKTDPKDQAAIIDQVERSLHDLETAYTELTKTIRDTYADFARQRYSNAVRLSDQVRTESLRRPLFIAGILGSIIGGGLAAGLALIGIVVDFSRRFSAAQS